MLSRPHTVAERYIVYRAERALLRAREDAPAAAAGRDPVSRRDGASPWDGADLRERIEFASHRARPLPRRRADRARAAALDPSRRSPRDDLQRPVVLNAKALIERDADFAKFAGRILLTYIYEEVLGWNIVTRRHRRAEGVPPARASSSDLQRGVEDRAHRPAAARLRTREARRRPRSHRRPRLRLPRHPDALRPLPAGRQDGESAAPHRDAAALLDARGDGPLRSARTRRARRARVIGLYQLYKSRRFCSSTPTLFNTGTLHSQLSSCYLYKVDDSSSPSCPRHRGKRVPLQMGRRPRRILDGGARHRRLHQGHQRRVARASSRSSSCTTTSSSPSTRAASARAPAAPISRPGTTTSRTSSSCARNTGDERRRTHDMNTANWIPDLFMKRMEARGQWTLFRSNEVPDLHDTLRRGVRAALRRTTRQRAAAGEIYGEKLAGARALEADAQDALRDRPSVDHLQGPVQRPQPAGPRRRHPLAAISAPRSRSTPAPTRPPSATSARSSSTQHLDADGELDHDKLRETIRIAVRALDNVIDINFYPTEPRSTANIRHRPIGLGVMGLQYALYRKRPRVRLAEAASSSTTSSWRPIAYYAYEASSDLAAERGTYSSLQGLQVGPRPAAAGHASICSRTSAACRSKSRAAAGMDWAPLRAKIAAQGMRNSQRARHRPHRHDLEHHGHARPASSRCTRTSSPSPTSRGDFIVLNPFLVRDLKAARPLEPGHARPASSTSTATLGAIERDPRRPEASAT